MIRPYHRQAIEVLAEHFKADPDVFALVLGRSLGPGFSSDDFDVDFMLVVTVEPFEKAKQSWGVPPFQH